MVAIRLRREGTRNRPFYRIVAIDHRKPRQGAYLENLGTYDPLAKKNSEKANVNVDGIDAWIAKGAQPSERVTKLLKIARDGGFTTTKKTAAAAAAE